ncbi:MAG TPA: (Fe-S)-binding protein [Syntrophales bacterium]|nr:(Fe-S)-binding protein [Syntrophales bacterium]HOL59162.1 (Fe-S)-binding protein [Syntrophales bacterium]HPO35757.1 (Fe-S)-binding protein [Syntrophales bacterium]
MELLNKAEKIVNACDRCGTCLTVCPLFEADGIERTAARGKNAIVRALGSAILEPGEEALKALDYCLLCRACVDACPGKVQTDEAVIYARQFLTDKMGGAKGKYRLIGRFLGSRNSIKGMGHVLSLLRRLKINRLLPLGLLPDEYLTAVAGPIILGSHTNKTSHESFRVEKVAYFEGCGMRLFFPSVAEKTKSLLHATVRRLSIPDNFCCGLPHLAHGLMEDFIRLSEKNVALFSDFDVIVTDCASCGSTLKHLARFIPTKEAASFSQRVMDLSEFLVKMGYTPRRQEDLSFTYHDPCHLIRGQGIKWEPRKLLSQAGDLREMSGADVCCGGAGSFHLDYPLAAKHILARKKVSIEATGAKMVITGCPGCMIQLSKLSIPVCHLSQVI